MPYQAGNVLQQGPAEKMFFAARTFSHGLPAAI